MKTFAALLMGIGVLFFAGCGDNTPVNSDVSSAAPQSPYYLSGDKTLDVNGVLVRYREEGDASKQTLVMVHGFSSSLETWDAIAADLKSEYHIVRLDLPGHGLTGPDPQERYSNEETVTLLADFLNALSLERPVLIGNSLGGLVAWRYALSAPDAVSRLVLIAPGGFSINGVTETPVPVPAMVKFYLQQAPLAGVTQATQALYADPEKLSSARVQQIKDLMDYPGNGDALVKRAAVFTLPAPDADLAKVTTPTLIIWGEKDRMVPPAHASRFMEFMPAATLKMYENAGHVPQEELSLRVAADIRAFLED